jgi:hypothetical protein
MGRQCPDSATSLVGLILLGHGRAADLILLGAAHRASRQGH